MPSAAVRMPRPNVLRDFLVVYGIVCALRTLPRLTSTKANAKQIIRSFNHQLKNRQNLKQALFAITLPRAYALALRRYPSSPLPAVLLASPLLHLIEPASLRRTLAVYVAAAAATASLTQKPRSLSAQTQSQISAALPLPPVWTLILAANSWLLWAFLFNHECFPRGYGDLILRYSGYGTNELTEDLIEFLQHTKFEQHPLGALPSHPPPPSSLEYAGNTDSNAKQSRRSTRKIHPGHTRAVCARLHPETSSCTETYVNAWITQFPQVFRWVGAFGAFALWSKRRGPRESPITAFTDWFIYSLRGTAFVVGSINTCWGLTCLFQRILPPGSLTRSRWIANGILGNFWILILPPKRRTDLALYSTRLAIVSVWDLLDHFSPKHGEVILLALAWSSLVHDQRRGGGPRGFGGTVLNYIDAHTTR